jgi:undecaprenyl pyrophosphate synthase
MAECKCSINDSMKSEYPFVKGVNENVECTLCNAKFCIAYGRRSDIVNHVKTKKKKKKHKLAVQNKVSNNSISNYLSTKNFSEMEKQ